MRFYIIHSPSTSENYIDNVHRLEESIIRDGDCVMNPLPDQLKDIGEKELYDMYKDNIKDCDVVLAMQDWSKTSTGNPEMAEALKHSVDILFLK